MKKCIIWCCSIGVVFTLHAQVTVRTKSFELESQNKHKGWVVLQAGKDDTSGEIFVKMGKATCDIDKSSVGNTTYTTFNGLGWTVDKLVFSPEFDFKSSSSKNYPSTRDALVNNELIFGEQYNAIPGGSASDALSGMAMPTRPINNSFMFSKIVVGTAGISGFKVATSYISTQLVGQVTKTRGDVCGENPAVFKVDAVDAKEQKGQRWIPMYNNPVPDGGNILFNTVGVSADPNVQHYVLRKYDKSGLVVKELALSFDYQCLPTVKEIEKEPGVFDYVVIISPINYKKSKLRVAAPNTYEFIKIDGETYEITERLSFSTPFSQWSMGYAVASGNDLYLAGVAGKNATTYLDFSIPKPDDYPNFQVVKIANGKLQFVTATTPKQTEVAAKSFEGLKNKAPFHYHLKDAMVLVKNGRLIISGQQEIGGERGALATAVFGITGELEAFLTKTEKTFARGHLSFNANGSSLYWLVEDFTAYNDVVGVNALIPKKAKVALAAVAVLTYNFDQKKITGYQPLINEEWAVNYKNPVLYDSETEWILLGNKITKKAKESEVVFITIQK